VISSIQIDSPARSRKVSGLVVSKILLHVDQIGDGSLVDRDGVGEVVLGPA